MKPFDNYEVHGIAELGKDSDRCSGQVPDNQAQQWSLYGRIPGQGLECIGVFKTRQRAEEVLTRIMGRRAAQRRVPPDPERMNDSRSAWAATAIAAFIDETGTDKEDALADLLADMMHYCDRHGFDFASELARGQTHYDAETERADP